MSKRNPTSPVLAGLVVVAVQMACLVRDAQAGDAGATYRLPLERENGGGWRWNEMLWGQGLDGVPAGQQTMPSDLASPVVRAGAGPNGGPALAIPADQRGEAGVYYRVSRDTEVWGRGRAIRAVVRADTDLGPHAAVQFVAYHAVWGWFAAEPARAVAAEGWTTVRWPLGRDSGEWVSLSGAIEWNDTIRLDLNRIGLRFFHTGIEGCENEAGAFLLAEVTVEGVDTPLPPLTVTRLEDNGWAATVGKRLELTFDLSRAYANPFDPDQVDVVAGITEADAQGQGAEPHTFHIPAFYFQDYERRLLADGAESLDPVGRACWKVRFTPLRPGRHTCILRVRDHTGARAQTPPRTFDVADAPFRGFIQVDPKDPAYLSYTDGSWFYPVGMIVRSPADERRQYAYDFEVHPDRGTFAYDEYFAGMAAAGMNFTRVWMSAWWTALEWSHGYQPDYGGVGRYNLLNAWRMDYVVDLAERLGIAIDVTLHNHGQFREGDFDQEWYDNAYYIGQGGPLESPEEFWHNAEARALTHKRLRYTVARWGASPAIGWWELCNEVDLVSDYDSASIGAWHREMAAYLKQTDPYAHIVTTHYTAGVLDRSVMGMSAIEIAQSTAYRADMATRVAEMWLDHAVFGKPVLINEFGVGNSNEQLRYNLHAGLWASSVTPFCGAALFWWWPYVHEKNQYPQYEALLRFLEGEDHRGKGYQLTSVRVEPIEPVPAPSAEDAPVPPRVMGMQTASSARLWLHDPRIYRAERNRSPITPVVRPVAASRMILDGLQPGRYRVELWDAWSGRAIHKKEQGHWGEEVFTVETPAFERDMACKIDRLTANP